MCRIYPNRVIWYLPSERSKLKTWSLNWHKDWLAWRNDWKVSCHIGKFRKSVFHSLWFISLQSRNDRIRWDWNHCHKFSHLYFRSKRVISVNGQSNRTNISHFCSKVNSLTWKITRISHFLHTVEGLKAIEIEKCKRDISDIKDQMYQAQKKIIDYSRLR